MGRGADAGEATGSTHQVRIDDTLDHVVSLPSLPRITPHKRTRARADRAPLRSGTDRRKTIGGDVSVYRVISIFMLCSLIRISLTCLPLSIISNLTVGRDHRRRWRCGCFFSLRPGQRRSKSSVTGKRLERTGTYSWRITPTRRVFEVERIRISALR